MDNNARPKVGVVIPCYKVRSHILGVLEAISSEVDRIYVVDDCCPDGSGALVEANNRDARVSVIRHEINQGVGGAVMTGYRAAIGDGMNIIIKLDGDGQMDPGLVPKFVAPIAAAEADYTKGNRFYDLEGIEAMPRVRLFGNAALSLITKLSSGYWNIFDPTNGYTAIHADVAQRLPFKKISTRYFFETDMLFRLNTLRAVVVDIPMRTKYGDEVSNMKIRKIVWEFMLKNMRNLCKRILYNYYLRDMSIASIELPIGLLLLVFGVMFGGYHWMLSISNLSAAPAGTVMLAAIPVIIGIQLILAFLAYDISTVPRTPFHTLV